MEAKLSTFGSMPTETVEETPIQETQTVTEETTTTETIAEAVEQTAETPAETIAEAVVEDNVSNYEMPSFDEPEATTTQEAAAPKEEVKPITDWREAIKAADRKEILKELGINEFAIELDEHISKGGKADDYILAKSRDWNNVTDLDVMRDEFKARFPNLTPEEIDRKLSRKYAIDDIDDEVRSDGLIDLKSDAYELRQQRIEKDKKLVLPQYAAATEPQKVIDDFIAEQQRLQNESYQKNVEFFANNEHTKSLLESKRVVVPIGKEGQFKFSVDKPELIMKGVTDANVWSKIVSNEKGEPDVQKLQQIVLFAANISKYNNDLVNYGKSLGHSKEVEEGQNARKPGSVAAFDNSATPSYRTGTYGSRN
jgi:hypothetical protein